MSGSHYPSRCVGCGNTVPRAAAHRCPICRLPFGSPKPIPPPRSSFNQGASCDQGPSVDDALPFDHRGRR